MAEAAKDGTDVGGRLQDWLRQRGVEATVAVGGRAAVGLSQESWFLRVNTEGGSKDVVLRLPTPASGTTSILRQRAALLAVAGPVPVPDVEWYDDGDANPFGAPFLVMSRVAGEVPALWESVPEPRRTLLAEHAIDVLADMHRIDPTSLADSGLALDIDLAWYRKRLDRFCDLPPVLRTALWWLERHDPGPAPRQAIVHSDFRMGNFVVSGDRIAGVLDWEMTAVGDPLADLVWCFIPVWTAPGVDEAAFTKRYAQAIGKDIDEQRLHWQLVLGHVRLLYYALSGARAFATGASQDLRLAALQLHLPVRLRRLAAAVDGDFEEARR